MSRLASGALIAVAAVLLLASVAAFRVATRTRTERRRQAWTVASAVCVLGCTYAAIGARKVS